MYHTKLVNAVVQMTIDLVRRKAKESLLVFYYAELSSRLQFAVFGDCFFFKNLIGKRQVSGVVLKLRNIILEEKELDI